MPHKRKKILTPTLEQAASGPRFTVAAIEVSTRLRARRNEIAVCWVSAHQGAPGNEKAGEYAKIAANGGQPEDAVPDDHRWETSLSHMARVATEARARTVAQWIAERTEDPRREYHSPPGKGLRHRLLRWTSKSVAGRYYQLLSGHAAIGPCLGGNIHKTADDRCWWCGGKKQTRHHLFTEYRVWGPQITRLWKDLGKAI